MQQDVFVLRPFCFCCYFQFFFFVAFYYPTWIIRYPLRECACREKNFSFREKIRENLSFVLHEDSEREKAQIRCRGYDRQCFLFASSCLYQIAWENRDSKLPVGDWCRLWYYDTLETWHCSRLYLDAQTQPSAAFPKHNENISLHYTLTGPLWMKSSSFKDVDYVQFVASNVLELFQRGFFSMNLWARRIALGIFLFWYLRIFLLNPQEQENTEILITS